MLVLHIGLVKTGTTLLQYRVFKPAPGLDFVHRKRGARALELTGTLRLYTQSKGKAAREQRRRILKLLNAKWTDTGKPLLVTDENVGLGPRLFWAGETAPPETVARRLAGLRDGLPARLLPMRVLLGIRRQDQWLGSCYAEYSLRHPDFCQADFDRRMRVIAESGEGDDSLGWLDFPRVRSALGGALDPENVLVVPLERLTEAPQETVAAIAALMGGGEVIGEPDLGGMVARPSNQLSSGSNAWRLRRDGAPLSLDADLQEAIRARFAASNAALAREMPLGFDA